MDVDCYDLQHFFKNMSVELLTNIFSIRKFLEVLHTQGNHYG
jgi:hypothetical protein